MKIRSGFVSNSSSSSFTCQISGVTESGWDISLEEAGMYECEHGHTFSEKYLLSSEIDDTSQLREVGKKEYLDYIKDNEIEYDEDEEEEYIDNYIDEINRYKISEKFCPLCQLDHVTKDDLILFLYARISHYTNLSVEKVIEYAKSDIKAMGREKFKQYCKGI